MLSLSFTLLLAAALCVIAAALHFACLVWGASGYRFLGAGENAVAAIEAGDKRPHISAVVVGTMLLIWAIYAIAGAGMLPAMPFMRPVLFLISGVLLARALLFPLLRPLIPGNSLKFWIISSLVVGVLGLLFLVGSLQLGQS